MENSNTRILLVPNNVEFQLTFTPSQPEVSSTVQATEESNPPPIPSLQLTPSDLQDNNSTLLAEDVDWFNPDEAMTEDPYSSPFGSPNPVEGFAHEEPRYSPTTPVQFQDRYQYSPLHEGALCRGFVGAPSPSYSPTSPRYQSHQSSGEDGGDEDEEMAMATDNAEDLQQLASARPRDFRIFQQRLLSSAFVYNHSIRVGIRCEEVKKQYRELEDDYYYQEDKIWSLERQLTKEERKRRSAMEESHQRLVENQGLLQRIQQLEAENAEVKSEVAGLENLITLL